MYIVETRIKTRGNKTIWMPYKQYRTTNGIENFQKRHQYLFDAGELRVTGNAEPRRSHIKSGEGMLRVGDILHESYGCGMTINKFYEVIAISPPARPAPSNPSAKSPSRATPIPRMAPKWCPRPRARIVSVASRGRASASRLEPMRRLARTSRSPPTAMRTRWTKRTSSAGITRTTWISYLLMIVILNLFT